MMIIINHHHLSIIVISYYYPLHIFFTYPPGRYQIDDVRVFQDFLGKAQGAKPERWLRIPMGNSAAKEQERKERRENKLRGDLKSLNRLPKYFTRSACLTR